MAASIATFHTEHLMAALCIILFKILCLFFFFFFLFMIVLPFFSIQGSHHYPPQLCFFSCGSCGRISMPPPARPHPFMGAPSVPSMVPEPSRPRHHTRFYGFQQGAVVGSTASSRPRPFSWVPFRDDFPEQPPTGNFRQAFQRTPPARKRFCSRRSRRQLCLSQKLGPSATSLGP